MAVGYGVDTYGVGVYGGVGAPPPLPGDPPVSHFAADLPVLFVEVAWSTDPFAGLLKFNVASLSNNSWIYIDLASVVDYVVQSGDCLEYDVYWPSVPSSQEYCAVDVVCDDGSRLSTSGAVDQQGRSAHPGTDLSPVAANNWYHRVIPLPPSWVGKTLTKYDLACDLGGKGISGPRLAYFRDVQISDGTALTHQAIWAQPDGVPNQLLDIAGATGGGGYGYNYQLTKGAPLTTPQWTDISPFVTGIRWSRGKNQELDQDENGAGEIGLEDPDRRFDPTNPSSPYAGGANKVLPMRPIRIRGIWPKGNLAVAGSFEGIDGDLQYPLGFGTAWIGLTDAAGFIHVGVPGGVTAQEGSRVLYGTVTGGSDDAFAQSAEYIPIEAGRSYTLAADFVRYSGSVNPNSKLQLICYDIDGLVLGRVTPTVAATGATLPTQPFNPATSFTRYGGQIRPSDFPAGTVKVKVEIVLARSASGAAGVAVDRVQLEPGAVANAFVTTAGFACSTGYIERIPSQSSVRVDRVSLPFTDGFAVLAQATTNKYRPTQQTDVRISSLLDDGGWSPVARGLAPGLSSVQPLGVISGNPTEVNVLEHILQVASAEVGMFFIDGNGIARFHSRLTRIANTLSKVKLYDQPTFASGLPFYTEIEPSFDLDRVVNYISLTPFSGGTTVYAQDIVSQRLYGKRSLDDAPIVATLADAQARAQFLLGKYAYPSERFDSLKLDPRRLDGLFPWVMSLELGDRITVERTPTLGAGTDTRDAFIEKLTTTISAERGQAPTWETEYQLSPADTQTFWILAGTTTDGYAATSTLGVSTRLAY